MEITNQKSYNDLRLRSDDTVCTFAVPLTFKSNAKCRIGVYPMVDDNVNVGCYEFMRFICDSDCNVSCGTLENSNSVQCLEFHLNPSPYLFVKVVSTFRLH